MAEFAALNTKSESASWRDKQKRVAERIRQIINLARKIPAIDLKEFIQCPFEQHAQRTPPDLDDVSKVHVLRLYSELDQPLCR